jgi:hypothetical protein
MVVETGDTAGHNQIILMNNVAVCWDAAHNHDNITAATCDPMMMQAGVDIQNATNVLPVVHSMVEQYLKLRGIQ